MNSISLLVIQIWEFKKIVAEKVARFNSRLHIMILHYYFLNTQLKDHCKKYHFLISFFHSGKY